MQVRGRETCEDNPKIASHRVSSPVLSGQGSRSHPFQRVLVGHCCELGALGVFPWQRTRTKYAITTDSVGATVTAIEMADVASGSFRGDGGTVPSFRPSCGSGLGQHRLGWVLFLQTTKDFKACLSTDVLPSTTMVRQRQRRRSLPLAADTNVAWCASTTRKPWLQR